MHSLQDVITVNAKQCQASKFDYIVIGSGAAGCATALTLAEKNHRVLIIEAGPLTMTEHVGSLSLRNHPSLLKDISDKFSLYATWKTIKGQSNEQCWCVAGGRTLFWGGHAPRFSTFDFINWPFDYSALQDDYSWCERIFNIESNFFNNDTQARLVNVLNNAKLSAAYSPLALNAHASTPSTLPWLFASSISSIIKSPYYTNDIKKNGIYLLCNSVAIKLLKNGTKIDAVVIHTNNETIELHAAYYILCGGAFHSTKLVQDSELLINSSLLGHSISEHIFLKGLIELNNPLPEPIYLYTKCDPHRPYIFEVQGPFKKTWYDPNYATVWLDWEKNERYLLLYGFGVMDVQEENCLYSTQSNNIAGYEVHFKYSQKDYSTIDNMKHHAQNIANSLNGSLLRAEIQVPGSSLHERGGLIMGESKEKSIVDTHGKFWSYNNLYCTDTAIWPSQGAANSLLSIMAIARYLTKKIA